MTDVKLRGFRFDRGIDAITFHAPSDTPLPPRIDQGNPPPNDFGTSELDRLFVQPSLNELLMRALKPQNSNVELLRPSAFSSALQDTREKLRQHARSSPRSRQTMENAISLLGDEIELRNLLSTYRNALLQG